MSVLRYYFSTSSTPSLLKRCSIPLGVARCCAKNVGFHDVINTTITQDVLLHTHGIRVYQHFNMYNNYYDYIYNIS
jgi:hypothetical protein